MKTLMEKTVYVPLDEATTVRDGKVMTDRWWVVDPKKGLPIYGGFSPQCNRNRELVLKLRDGMYPELQVRHFPVVYLGNIIREEY